MKSGRLDKVVKRSLLTRDENGTNRRRKRKAKTSRT